MGVLRGRAGLGITAALAGLAALWIFHNRPGTTAPPARPEWSSRNPADRPGPREATAWSRLAARPASASNVPSSLALLTSESDTNLVEDDGLKTETQFRPERPFSPPPALSRIQDLQILR